MLSGIWNLWLFDCCPWKRWVCDFFVKLAYLVRCSSAIEFWARQKPKPKPHKFQTRNPKRGTLLGHCAAESQRRGSSDVFVDFRLPSPFGGSKREDCSELWSSSFRAALVGFGIHILVRAFEVAGLSSILVVVKAGLCTETTSDKVQRSIDTSSFL